MLPSQEKEWWKHLLLKRRSAKYKQLWVYYNRQGLNLGL